MLKAAEKLGRCTVIWQSSTVKEHVHLKLLPTTLASCMVLTVTPSDDCAVHVGRYSSPGLDEIGKLRLYGIN